MSIQVSQQKTGHFDTKNQGIEYGAVKSCCYLSMDGARVFSIKYVAVSLCRSINFLTFGDKEICLHYIFVTCPNVNGRLQSRDDLRVYLHRVTKFAVYFPDGTVCNGVGLNGHTT